MKTTSPYPDCVIARLLYVGRHYAIFLPHAKGSVTKERKRYERLYPGVNAHVFAMLDAEKAKPWVMSHQIVKPTISQP